MALSTIFKRVAVLALSLLTTSCSSLLYHPTPTQYIAREKLDTPPEDLRFPSSDGTMIHAWNFRSKVAKPANCALIQFHGNGQNMTTHFAFLYWMLKYGYDFMTFDYHGYGLTPGHPSPEAVVQDGHAALRKMRELYPKKKIVVIGQSLGGAIALRSVLDLKNEIPVSLVVADSTFASFKSVGRSVSSRSWITWPLQPLVWLFMSDKYAVKDDIASLSPIPLLVVHGNRDPVVDISQGRDLFDRAAGPKEFWEIPGGGHTALMADPVFAEKLIRRLDTLCR